MNYKSAWATDAAPDQPTQPQNPVLAHDTTISLLDCPQMSEPPGHLTPMQLHLNGIAQAPGTTTDQKKLAEQINTDLNTTKVWLEKVRLDAQQLAMMTDDQLRGAQALRYRMAVDARYAVEGGIDPITQQVQPNVGQMCDSIMLLASLRVMPYT